ncbi:pullulanase-type alpha-1,6-glucosidase [Thalassotalea euphylliae]|uniref:Pullulanase-type alpha-1,6-glucosidase n=1 Tax=Thalassotalea euphylliae TaxID=1655234 RepID=A0A3E0TUB4_9GAMM|nr:pullulanase-type alpha-1,6-glucosidase [Thalassotalea euphylliae]REL27983.1 pullulanase-type alpha-1,6-glucosidase [Thalassotalea euphylliae]
MDNAHTTKSNPLATKQLIPAILLPTLVLSAGCQPTTKPSTSQITTNQAISLYQQTANASAHWLSKDVLVLANADSNKRYRLATRPIHPQTGALGEKQLSTALAAIELPAQLAAKFPHLSAFPAFKVNLDSDTAKTWLKQPLYVYEASANNASAQQAVTYVQTSAVIDALYTQGANDADEVSDLGAVIKSDGISVKLWAPTAQSVSLLLYKQDKSPAQTAKMAMSLDKHTGTWQANLPASSAGLFYQYQISVYHPATGIVEQIVTTDPYSLSLSTNSEYSQIVDLNSAATKPLNWDKQQQPQLTAPEDAVLYEMHIRDFSANEANLSNPAYRGKYKAFTEQNSDGMNHLNTLKAAGLNHVHLLPAFDIGTVNEARGEAFDLHSSVGEICSAQPNISLCSQNFANDRTLEQILAQFDERGGDAQALVTELKTFDKYNWGYDPFHYTVPEGSYAINPDGISRIVEFREMVQHLHHLGFRVVMDVVYNHTHKARLERTAVLDKIVPNYYQRLHPLTGQIEQSTCCDNTATERVMMAKLMTDSLLVWARDYKIDGFRFDLMGHQPKDLMLAAREAVRAVDPDTYFYGEGWNFGEVANNRQFVQASQLELGGSEIGTFSDRLRDAVRGAGFNIQGDDIRRNQGIGNGLMVRPNELNSDTDTKAKLAPDYHLLMDQLRVGLTGNLADYPITNHDGKNVTGKDIPYGGAPTGYAQDPADTINYVSKHDNQTLWDNNQYRNAFDLTTAERVRLHNQSLSYALLAQGIPFIHMGSELLRSKSYLRDSYDYSDWFNRVDFSKQQNFYSIGLPPVEKDQANWPLIARLLDANQGRDKPSGGDIELASQVFADFLAVRASTRLLRLTNKQDIIDKLSFLNTGANQQQGLIVMHIDNHQGRTVADNYQQLVVLFNAAPTTQSFTLSEKVSNAATLVLHPRQQNGADNLVKTSQNQSGVITVPAFTTAIFVQPKSSSAASASHL